MKKRTEGAVAAIIVNNCGQVLLTQRDRDPMAGVWHLPGGGIEVPEGHLDAYHREISEELRVEVSIISGPVAATSCYFPVADRNVLCVYFVAMISAGTPCKGDATRDLRWCDREEVERLMRAGELLDVCREALNQTFGWQLPKPPNAPVPK